MITAQEVLFRGRKGRNNIARAYRNTRKKHGNAAARSLWNEVKRLQDWQPAPERDSEMRARIFAAMDAQYSGITAELARRRYTPDTLYDEVLKARKNDV